MPKQIWTICFFFLLGHSVFAQVDDSLRVGIFSGMFLKKIVLFIQSPGYALNGTPLGKGEVMQIELTGDSLAIAPLSGKKTMVKRIELLGPLETGHFKLKVDGGISQEYYGSLEIKVIRGIIRLVNTIDFHHYIAGVIDAETGTKSQLEFYKVQAIIARTYAYENLQKHQDFGFNLCDQVHCQAFKGTDIRNPLITQAAIKTKGLVLFEPNGTLAFAPYHSNCGGQTETSENVWGGAKAYLKPVKDSFCIHQSKASWETRIPMKDWNKWLTRNHLDAMHNQQIDWEQPERKKEVKLGGKTFTTRKIRTDFGLSSSFFSIKTNYKEVIFQGRGYGHGVGVCQQGATRMADAGWDFQRIIAFYYDGLRIGKVK